MNRHLALGYAALFALILALANAATAQDALVRYRVPVTRNEPSRGPDDALVTIVAITDFECPFSARAQASLDRLVAAYPRDVRIVHRNNPLAFHSNANVAAQAAMEAFAQGGNAAFWAMHAKLFANQRLLDVVNLERYATELHLDVPRFHRALLDGRHAGEITADQAIAAVFRIESTPNFMINGRVLRGAVPYEEFDAIVREEVASAEALVRGGTPRAGVYLALTRNGLARAEEAPAPRAPTPTPTQRRAPDPNAIYAVPVGTSPVRGRADALVTIVEFTDLQCPFCARVQGTLEQLAQSYGRDVRFVLKHNPLPFHDRAQPIARLLVWAATRGRAWQLHDRIFANQANIDDGKLVAYAVACGLDARGARAALADTSLDAAVRADQDLAASLGATGTPSFFINGRNLRGAQPIDAFRTIIDEELAKARAAVAAGTPAASLYQSIVQSGLTAQRMIDAPAPPNPAVAPDDRVYQLAVPADAPTRGATGGRVVVQQFSDFQCPFCSRVEPTVDALLARFGDRVTLVWRDYPLPFHNNALPAAEAAREVRAQLGVPAFWRYHAALFANQQALGRTDLVRYAAALGGVDMRRFRAALDRHTHQAAIQADINAVTAAGAQIGTPTFFINGRLVQGAQPLDVFVAAIERALAEPGTAGSGAPPTPATAGVLRALADLDRRLVAPSDVAAIPANARRTASGLASRVLTRGTGQSHPAATSRVEVHYTGWTTDGRMFDSSVQRGTPATFPLNGVIAGWTEVVQLMVEGETRRAWIPAALAYGDSPRAGAPRGMLVFDIQLIRIVAP